MKRSLYFILPAVFAFNSQNVSALEIDEKLTLRFLKVSSSKKTVLVNRGGEDGLVVGDHAKFFITAGVVARGVVEKVSPSRSVWSLYRVVDATEITEDKVLNLKIASPVKITEDPSKSLKEEAIPGGTETMNVEDADAKAMSSAGNEEVIVNDSDKDELKELGIEDSSSSEVTPKTQSTSKGKKAPSTSSVTTEELALPAMTNTSKTWEAWGTMYVNSVSGTYESNSPTAANSTSATGSTLAFSLGIEKYFLNFNNFLKETSLSAFVHKRSIESGDTIQSTTDWLEFGLGLNYHFFNSASSVNKLIGYGAVSLGKGTATIESKTATQSTTPVETSAEGSNSFFSVGIGAKYVLSNGFGVRGVLDYYSTSETYEYSDTEETVTRKLSGPRVQFGLSYRF